jgi:type I restriction enzyme M protein
MARSSTARKQQNGGANLGFEQTLWLAADKLRGHMDAAEYKHVVLGLIFLKYISDAFEEQHAKLKAEKGADPEDRDEYVAVNIFWVPREARWTYLQGRAKDPLIGRLIDDAMVAIERDNPSLKGVLPKDYARPALDKRLLGELIDLVSTIGLGNKENRSKDILGRVYEYFLGQFAGREGKKGGEFYTPRCVVKLLVEMIEPFKGRVYDPCCGSSGMFVQSEEFIVAHGRRVGDIAIYGQESNPTTWKLAKMNLAIRGIEADLGDENGDSFHRDLHKPSASETPRHRRAHGVSAAKQYGRRNANCRPLPLGLCEFAWVQHIIHHLTPSGVAGFVLANGSMSSNSSGEGDIRKAIIEADLVDCMVALPGQLFYSTPIPVCLWFVARDKRNHRHRDRRGQTLFIDARKLGTLIDRVHRELTEADIGKIAGTYHAWRGDKDAGKYQDIAGFCMSAKLADIRAHGHVLTPGRYVGAEEAEDDLPAPRPGLFFVYAIECEGGSHYIGQTDDLRQRWQEHRSGQGADWTKTHKPQRIAHYEEFTSREAAVAREKELKTTAGRRWLKDAIANGRARQAGGEPFEQKMKRLTGNLEQQFAESAKLEKAIRRNLAGLETGR